MKKNTKLLLFSLLFWFTLDITGFSLGNFTLVESPGIKSIDFIWWLFFIMFSILYLLKKRIGKYILSIFLVIWTAIQYTSHWHYTIFGVSERKLSSYNSYFRNTYHIIPASTNILIPDLYHIILHVLIISSLISLVVSIVKKRI
ncbi:hypothetical protein IMX26_07215 [Clostridium sp. 'deep sea']|uniref:hypothetical protein n=1 Tax=Clostridium sp. 'deep sea' TaxID=2779445 RepID=UPI0018965E8A|nr:hypothetical protein [Clostridium sp. 'deep sea']QOR36590.1 hypothetical protein IMX26_07215 [Clostridium sp. 'deep sea']